MSARCKSCGAEIRWVDMLSGKRMPVDARPEKRVVLTPSADPLGRVVDAFVPHWSTCPDAAKFRRPRS